MPTFLAEVTSGFDISGVFDVIVGAFEKILPLFTKFPLNIFLGGSIIGVGVALFRKLKKA